MSAASDKRNRERCLAYRQAVIDEDYRQRELVETLPMNQIILVTFRAYFIKAGPRPTETKWADTLVACIPIHFNDTSIRSKVIAVRDQEATPFSFDARKINEATGRHALKFQYIKNWELIEPTMYPLLLGYQIRYPLLSKLLKG